MYFKDVKWDTKRSWMEGKERITVRKCGRVLRPSQAAKTKMTQQKREAWSELRNKHFNNLSSISALINTDTPSSLFNMHPLFFCPFN